MFCNSYYILYIYYPHQPSTPSLVRKKKYTSKMKNICPWLIVYQRKLCTTGGGEAERKKITQALVFGIK